jgi:hypothetical protein
LKAKNKDVAWFITERKYIWLISGDGAPR